MIQSSAKINKTFDLVKKATFDLVKFNLPTPSQSFFNCSTQKVGNINFLVAGPELVQSMVQWVPLNGITDNGINGIKFIQDAKFQITLSSLMYVKAHSLFIVS